MIYKNKKALLSALVRSGDKVLDVGFWGQGSRISDSNWPHRIIESITNDVYGLDLDFDTETFKSPRYQKVSAEQFDFSVKFDVIFAGDLIEHLSNPGLFLQSCRRNLADDGKLILTTPNAFNLFNLTEKLTKREPTVNPDHTVYFNSKVLKKLLEKNGMKASEIGYCYSLEYTHKESFKKKFLNVIYRFFSRFTEKFIETLVVVAVQAANTESL